MLVQCINLCIKNTSLQRTVSNTSKRFYHTIDTVGVMEIGFVNIELTLLFNIAMISCFLLYRAGPNMWRDDQLPCDILNWYCDRHGIEEPIFEGSERVRFNGRTYTLNEFGESLLIGIQCTMVPLHSIFSTVVLLKIAIVDASKKQLVS